MIENPFRPMHLNGLRYRGGRHSLVMGGARVEPDALIVHYSAGGRGLDALREFIRKRPKQASYNWTYDQDGGAGEFVEAQDASWHSGDGWAPAADDVLESGFVPVADVPKPPKRWTNLRSRSVCMVNRGWVNNERAIRLRRQGQEVLEARHRNPASRATLWHGYTDDQYQALEDTLPFIVQECPSLRIVLGHEDVTNGFIFGKGKWKGGSKVDPGAVWDWDRIPWQKFGLTVVRYDYDDQGWRAYRELGKGDPRSYNGPGSVPARVEVGP